MDVDQFSLNYYICINNKYSEARRFDGLLLIGI